MEGQIVQCSYTELIEKKDGNNLFKVESMESSVGGTVYSSICINKSKPK